MTCVYPATTIQFGTYTPPENEYQQYIASLLSQNYLLTQQLITRENELQKDKDEFMSSLSLTLEKNKNEKAELQQRIDSYDKELAQLKKSSTELKSMNERLMNENAKFKSNIDNATKSNNGLTRQLNIEKSLSSQLNLEKETALAQMRSLEKENSVYEARITELERQNASANKKIASMENDVREAHNSRELYEKMSQEVNKARKQIVRLTKQVDEDKANICKLQQSATKLEQGLEIAAYVRGNFETISNITRMFLDMEMAKIGAAFKTDPQAVATVLLDFYDQYTRGALDELLQQALDERHAQYLKKIGPIGHSRLKKELAMCLDP